MRNLRCSRIHVGGIRLRRLYQRIRPRPVGEEMPFVYFRREFHSLPVGDDQAAGKPGQAPARASLPVVIELDLGWM